MPKDVWETETSKKKSKKSTSSKSPSAVTSSGGWGMFDTIAAVSQGNSTAMSHAQSMSQTNDDKWGHHTAQTAVNNAINQGASEGGWNANEEQVAVTGEPFVREEVPKEEKVPKKVIEPKVKQYNIPGVGDVSSKLYKLYQSLMDRGYSSTQAKQIIKLGVTEEKWADENLQTLGEKIGSEGLSGLPLGVMGMAKAALTKPPYENEFLGSAGAANILNKLNSITDPKEKQEYVNKILKSNKGAEEIFGYPAAAGLDISPSEFEQKLREANQGNKNFDKNYHETAGAYWELNPAQTSGAMEDMATAYQQGNLKMTKGNTLAIQQAMDAKQGKGLAGLGGGGGGGGILPVDPTDPDANLMPSGTYLASQYNQALVPDPNMDPYQNAMYTGGPEQRHIAGGYWDPNTHQWVGGSPWGTQNLWQGANPTSPEVTTMAEGGPVRAPSSKVTQGGGGLFDFKPYGF